MEKGIKPALIFMQHIKISFSDDRFKRFYGL